MSTGSSGESGTLHVMAGVVVYTYTTLRAQTMVPWDMEVLLALCYYKCSMKRGRFFMV